MESSDSGSGEGAAVEAAESECACMVGHESGVAERDIKPCSMSHVIDAVSPHALSFTPTRSRCSEGSVASSATATAPQCTTCTVVQHEDGVHTPDFMVPFMEEAFEGMQAHSITLPCLLSMPNVDHHPAW